VLKDKAPPTVEWDFAAPSGQPFKVEISTRLVEQNGHVQTLYLAGGKIVCNLDGLTKKGPE
jgi:hypothetical protein